MGHTLGNVSGNMMFGKMMSRTPLSDKPSSQSILDHFIGNMIGREWCKPLDEQGM